MKRINRARAADRARARHDLYYQQFGLCFWCWRPTVLTYRTDGIAEPDEASLDHLIPRADGGGNRRENLVLSCWACNNMRGNMGAAEFSRRASVLRRFINKDIRCS